MESSKILQSLLILCLTASVSTFCCIGDNRGLGKDISDAIFGFLVVIFVLGVGTAVLCMFIIGLAVYLLKGF